MGKIKRKSPLFTTKLVFVNNLKRTEDTKGYMAFSKYLILLDLVQNYSGGKKW